MSAPRPAGPATPLALALAALLVAGGCGGLVFPCSADLAIGDAVEITLAEVWGYGTTYGWDAVNVWPREGPWCDGVDSLRRGATIRLRVVEMPVGWVQDNRGEECRPSLAVVTSDVGTPLTGSRPAWAPGNALLSAAYSGCGESYCDEIWLFGVFIADDRSLFAPLVPGEPARVAVMRQIQGADAAITCTDIWAAEVRRVE